LILCPLGAASAAVSLAIARQAEHEQPTRPRLIQLVRGILAVPLQAACGSPEPDPCDKEEGNMRTEDEAWMVYIDGEVRAACAAKGWAHQVRRKDSARPKPLSQSPIDDYQWKLIPGERGELPEARPGDFDGEYYVLWLDRVKPHLVLQHDTNHVGVLGAHWEQETYTTIDPRDAMSRLRDSVSKSKPVHPPQGWLRDHLLTLVARCLPNRFSVT
jgi:hypothetical protein